VTLEYLITPELEKDDKGEYRFWGVGWTWEYNNVQWVFHLQKGASGNFLVFYGKLPPKPALPAPEHRCPKQVWTVVNNCDRRVVNNYTTATPTPPLMQFISPGGISMARNPGLTVGQPRVQTTRWTVVAGAVGWRRTSCSTASPKICDSGSGPGETPDPGSVITP
jgi:hypothetical protein